MNDSLEEGEKSKKLTFCETCALLKITNSTRAYGVFSAVIDVDRSFLVPSQRKKYDMKETRSSVYL